MTDEELIERLRDVGVSDHAVAVANLAADRIDALLNRAAAMQIAGWRDPSEYADYVGSNADELVQVMCEVVPDEDGDYVSIGDHAVGDKFVSIGLRLLDERDEWPWDVAGWDMQQDCFVPARGFRVVGWQPLPPVALSIPTDAAAALEERDRQVRDGALESAAKWCDKKLARAKSSRDEAKALGAPSEMQRSWLAVISHIQEAAAAIRALKGGE